MLHLRNVNDQIAHKQSRLQFSERLEHVLGFKRKRNGHRRLRDFSRLLRQAFRTRCKVATCRSNAGLLRGHDPGDHGDFDACRGLPALYWSKIQRTVIESVYVYD